MKVGVVGLGNMGASFLGALLIRGYEVVGIDKDPQKAKELTTGACEIIEANLREAADRALSDGRLCFTSDLKQLAECGLAFVAVQTPSVDSRCDYSVIENLLSDIDRHVPFAHDRGSFPVIIGSTLFPGSIHTRLLPRLRPGTRVELIYHPVFLRAGSGVQDTLEPGKLVVGCANPSSPPSAADELLHRLAPDTEVTWTGYEEAEFIKLIHNTFMCCKINFANEMQSIARPSGSDSFGIMKPLFEDETRTQAERFDASDSIWSFHDLMAGQRPQVLLQPDAPEMANYLSKLLDQNSYTASGQTATALRLLRRREESASPARSETLRPDWRQLFHFAWAATLEALYEEFGILCAAYQTKVASAFRTAMIENRRGRLLTVSHMRPGPPYSGPCLTKDADILAGIVADAPCYDLLANGFLLSVRDSNSRLIDTILADWLDHQGEQPLGMIGLSFRPDYPEYRLGFALEIINRMRQLVPNVKLISYDSFLSHANGPSLDSIARGDQDVRALREFTTSDPAKVVERCQSIIVNTTLATELEPLAAGKHLIRLY